MLTSSLPRLLIAALLLTVGCASPTPPVPAVQAVVVHTATPILDEAGGQAFAEARPGEAFRLAGESGEYFEVYLFSGEARYLARSAASVEKLSPVIPSELARRQAVFRAIVAAEDRAQEQADAQIDPSRFEANVDLGRLLQDKFTLQACRSQGITPVAGWSISIEGASAGWSLP